MSDLDGVLTMASDMEVIDNSGINGRFVGDKFHVSIKELAGFINTRASNTLTREEMEREIMQAIGEASMCWSNINGAGIFDSSRAKVIAEKLYTSILNAKMGEK